MKILLIGKNGQVGWQLERALAPLGEVMATDKNVIDMAKHNSIISTIQNIKPDLIVNASAYTAVDKAESDADTAMSINASALSVIATEAKKINAVVIHYSTDYVFDGAKNKPYTENDTTNPMGIYGKSKLEGEKMLAEAGVPYLIFRTSWVYDTRGKNFLLTMLRLAQEREEMRVVNDQTGSPTWAKMIAMATSQIISQGSKDIQGFIQENKGIYHMTSAGETTWYNFAKNIIENAAGQKNFKVKSIIPITTNEYPTPAKRPQYSVMDNSKLKNTFNISIPSWEKGLKLVLEELKHD